MTYSGLLLFLGGVFGLRVFGAFGLGGLIGDNERWTRLLALLPLSVVASVVAVQTFTVGRAVAIDARVVGVAVAAIASWRRLPLGFVVLAAAAATALVRFAGWG